MARPRNADAADTRRRILEAAIQRFGEHGVKATSLRVIAADAGVTFATVHHYFGSKAELFDRCQEACYLRLRDFRSELLAALGAEACPAVERVRRLAEAAFDYAMDQRTVTRFLLRVTLYENNNLPRGREAQNSYLDIASEVLAPIVDQPAAALRVPLQGFMFLLTRLAIVSPRELEVMAGARDIDSTRAALRRYLGDVAVATLTTPATAA